MKTLKIADKELNIEFEYNDFCDTNLLEETDSLMKILGSEDGSIKNVQKLFCVVRELLFIGSKDTFNDIKEAGHYLDLYRKEEPGEGEEEHTLTNLFALLTEELFNEGFLSDLLGIVETEEKTVQLNDHKKSTKKK